MFDNSNINTRKNSTCEGNCCGGSIRILGSQAPGGRTVTASKNSSTPARRSCLLFALYATSWKTYKNKNTEVF